MECAQRQTATILPFEPMALRRKGGLTVSDRIQVMQWTDEVRRHGVRAVRYHEPEPGDDPAVGPFLLIYRFNELWAAWGIARRLRGYEVWRASTGCTVGVYDTMRAALSATLAAS